MVETTPKEYAGESVRDEMHRGAKLLMDAGDAGSREEAIAMLHSFRVSVYVGPEVSQSATLQAALLTLVNAGNRCFLGGVTVIDCPSNATQTSFPGPTDLAAAVVHWGGRLASEGDPTALAVVLGDASPPPAQVAPALRASFDGWSGAVFPWDSSHRLPEAQEFGPSGVLAGALAASECFQHLRGRNVRAMRRPVGLSLWRPDVADGWDSVDCRGPKVAALPEKIWVIGLGHLGQAFLWTLMTLPYPRATGASLTLQDFDLVKKSNESTSLLTFPEDRGRKKTRIVAAACEERGFDTILVERPFDDRFRRVPDDPSIAFCGVDKPAPRRALEAPGFLEVIEAGLGHEAEEYLAFALHVFPSSRAAANVWPATSQHTSEALLDRPAYQHLAKQGMDRCGILEIAGASVAVPFVGAAVSTLAVAETLRAVMQEHRYELLEGTLRDLEHSSAVSIGKRSRVMNLGSVGPY